MHGSKIHIVSQARDDQTSNQKHNFDILGCLFVNYRYQGNVICMEVYELVLEITTPYFHCQNYRIKLQKGDVLVLPGRVPFARKLM